MALFVTVVAIFMFHCYLCDRTMPAPVPDFFCSNSPVWGMGCVLRWNDGFSYMLDWSTFRFKVVSVHETLDAPWSEDMFIEVVDSIQPVADST